MSATVKKVSSRKMPSNREGSRRRSNETRVSSKHQVTIPKSAFSGADLHPGDTLRAEAAATGRVVLTRIDELIDRYSGCLDTKGQLRQQVTALRDEWR